MIDVELPTASPAGALTRGFAACLAPVTEVPVTELPLPAGDLPQWIAVVRTPDSDPTGTTQAGGGGGRRIGCREGPAER